MSTFEYTAKDTVGNIQTGIYTDIASVKALRTELKKMGYKLLKAKCEKQNILTKNTFVALKFYIITIFFKI